MRSSFCGPQRTVGSYLSRNRDRAAARIFFRRVLKRHGEPRTITLDGFETESFSFTAYGHAERVQLPRSESSKDPILSILKQHRQTDHRRVKLRVSAMLGFKSFGHARKVLNGIELIQKLKKGQYGVPFSFGITSREIWQRVLAA